jgi:cytochrome c oxidase subunit 2
MSLWPEAASDAAARVDPLFFTLLGVTGTVAVALTLIAIAFCVRYRRGSSADRSAPPVQHRGLEVGWTAATTIAFAALFAWGASVYPAFYRPSAEATEVFVVGKQWMWKVQHPSGRREVGEVHLPLGRTVRVVLASEDVIHSFYVPAFRLKQDAVPGRYTGLTFIPTRAGTFDLRCAEYCGTDHAHMLGRVVVMPAAQFQAWLSEGAPPGSMAERGFEAFRRLGCSGCHSPRSTVHAPELDGLYGRAVHLQDGRTVMADEAYLRDSILLPKRDVVAGFEPLMPSFAGQVSEEELLELIAYLRSRASR